MLPNPADREVPRCSYVDAEAWRYADPSPFCDAPAVRGSAYCARHQALCRLAPGSPAAIAAAEALAQAGETPPPPRELGFLDALPIPEPEGDVTERDAIDDCLDRWDHDGASRDDEG
jgi:hypothetical protein